MPAFDPTTGTLKRVRFIENPTIPSFQPKKLRNTQFLFTIGGMSDTKEHAVKTYLDFLENPEAVDRGSIAELENQFSVAGSPIVKLRVLAEIDRVRRAGRAALEDGFIRDASAWAAENRIPPSAFLALGVDQELLAKAGFELPPTQPPRHPGANKSSSKSSKETANRSAILSNQVERKPRAKSVTSETVETLILATTEPFSVRDIVDISQATNATVSRVVGWLVAAQRVEKIGLLSPQGSRGIAPSGYRVKNTQTHNA